MVPTPYRMVDKRQETHDTWTLRLEPAGGVLGAFAPGQFAMLYAFGIGEAPISVSGDVGAGGPLVHTVRSVGAVTQAICALRAGRLRRGPRAVRQHLADRRRGGP